jgi:hypothetical protein
MINPSRVASKMFQYRCSTSESAVFMMNSYYNSNVKISTYAKTGCLGIVVTWGKIWGCWAGEARPTPPIFFLTPAIPNEPENLRRGLAAIIWIFMQEAAAHLVPRFRGRNRG